MKSKIKLVKYEIRELKKIVSLLKSNKTKELLHICPFLSTLSPYYNQCDKCNALFPSLRHKKTQEKTNFLFPCPCHAIEVDCLSINYAIRKLNKVIKQGYIR